MKNTKATDWLTAFFSTPNVKNPCPVTAIIAAGQAVGLHKADLKAARKELGVVSINANGVQYWWRNNDA